MSSSTYAQRSSNPVTRARAAAAAARALEAAAGKLRGTQSPFVPLYPSTLVESPTSPSTTSQPFLRIARPSTGQSQTEEQQRSGEIEGPSSQPSRQDTTGAPVQDRSRGKRRERSRKNTPSPGRKKKQKES